MSFDKELEELGLRGDLNYESIFRYQIINCLRSATDSDISIFEHNVDLLRRMLPRSVKETEEYKKALAELTEDQETYVWERFCGVKLGSIEEPLMWNDPQNPGYDPKKPTVPSSPRKVTVTITDWFGVFELCLGVADKLGIAWKKLNKGGAI